MCVCVCVCVCGKEGGGGGGVEGGEGVVLHPMLKINVETGIKTASF